MFLTGRHKNRLMLDRSLKSRLLVCVVFVSALSLFYFFYHRQASVHKRSYARHMQVAYSGTPEEYVSAKIASHYETRFKTFLDEHHWPGLDFGLLKTCFTIESEASTNEANKRRMSETYLKGSGIELGFGNSRLYTSNSKVSDIKYIRSDIFVASRTPVEDNKKILTNNADITDSYHLLASITRDSLDFIVVNNALQYTEHVILSIYNYLRVLKTNGFMFLVLPHRCFTSSRHRVVTSYKHMLQEYNDHLYIQMSRAEHFREFALNQFQGELPPLVPQPGSKCNELAKTLQQQQNTNVIIAPNSSNNNNDNNSSTGGHTNPATTKLPQYHAFDQDSVVELLDRLRYELEFPFIVREFVMQGAEMIVILQKI